MKQYTDSFALWQDIQNGLLVANPVADVPGIWKIHNKETHETMFTFSDETENFDPCLELTVDSALQRRKWYSRYILGCTHGHQVNWELKVWIARAIRNNPADGPVILSVEQINALMEEIDLTHANSKMIANSNQWQRDRYALLEKDAAAFKFAVRQYIDFVTSEAPEDKYCMCGEESDSREHSYHEGSHAFFPAFQYSEQMARQRVEAFYPKINGGNGPLTTDEPKDVVEIEHTDLQGNVGIVKVKTHAAIPDECAASGQSCSYAPEGPKGEMQCKYCGKPMTSNKQAELYAQATGANVYADGKLVAGQHDLWKDGDFGVPDVLKDRNGQVVLGQCKVCGAAEQELIDIPLCPGSGKKVFRHG